MHEPRAAGSSCRPTCRCRTTPRCRPTTGGFCHHRASARCRRPRVRYRSSGPSKHCLMPVVKIPASEWPPLTARTTLDFVVAADLPRPLLHPSSSGVPRLKEGRRHSGEGARPWARQPCLPTTGWPHGWPHGWPPTDRIPRQIDGIPNCACMLGTTGLFSHSWPPPARLDLSRQNGWSFAQSVAYRCERLFSVISEKSTCPG